MKPSAIILGAGASGLAVAWGLSETGCAVTLIEAGDRVGGLAGSRFSRGYTFDYGPHSFYSRDPAILERVRGLLGDDLREYGMLYGGKKIVFRGRTLDYPLSVASAAANLPPGVLLRCGADYLWSAVRRLLLGPRPDNFRDWIILHFGRGLYGGKKIVFRGRTLDYPLSVASAAANLPPGVLLRCGADYLWSAARRLLLRPRPDNFRDWIILHFGRGLYDHFFGPFSRKTWGVPPETLAANFASERIPRIDPRRMLGAIFRRKAGRDSKSGPLQGQDGAVRIHYPKKGYWQISHAIAEQVRAAGGTIHLSSRVRELRTDGQRVSGVVFDRGTSSDLAEADWVISTLPVPELVRAMPGLERETREAGEGLTYRGLALLFLEVARPQVLPTRVVYFHDPGIIFQRGSEVRYLSPDTVPGEGRTGLTLEITDNRGLDDRQLYEQSLAGLEQLGLLAATDVENHTVVRRPYCYPVYTIGYRERLRRYLEGMSGIENLLHCGRQALFRYVDVYQCLQMGLATARSILDGTAPGAMDDIVSSWGGVKN